MFVAVGRVDDGANDRNTGKTAYPVGRGYDLVAQFGTTLFVTQGLGAQHQMWKIDIPFMRWDIGAFGQKAQVAQIAVIDHLPVIFRCHAIDFHAVALVDQVEQGWESIAKVDAATTSMTDIENTFEFGEDRGLVVKTWIVLSQRMTSRGVETTLARCSRHQIKSVTPALHP